MYVVNDLLGASVLMDCKIVWICGYISYLVSLDLFEKGGVKQKREPYNKRTHFVEDRGLSEIVDITLNALRSSSSAVARALSWSIIAIRDREYSMECHSA